MYIALHSNRYKAREETRRHLSRRTEKEWRQSATAVFLSPTIPPYRHRYKYNSRLVDMGRTRYCLG